VLRPRLILCLLSVVLAALFMPAAPVLDEESYLDIARQMPWLRPYDWYRAWQPWGAEVPEDSFLFAHPPLHVYWIKLTGGLRAAGLLWAGLLGLAAGDICERSRDPWGSAAVWMSSPIVALSLVMTLGIDLPVVALSTAAVALYLRDRMALAGLVLGLAIGWKYPAVLLLPVLIWHGRRRSVPLVAGAAAVVTLVQLFLWVQYGRPHVLEVLLTAGDIGRGPLLERFIGVLARLGTTVAGASPFAVLGLGPALLVEQDHGLAGSALLAVLSGCGLALLIRAGRLRGLYGVWALVVVAGVVLAHNYADGRYLLPAVLPLAMVCGGLPRLQLRIAAGLQALLAVGLVHGELRYAEEAAAVALDAERYTGEWSFASGMQDRGARFWSSDEDLPKGTLVAVPVHASPGPVPESWEELSRTPSEGGAGLRLIDLEHGVGWHADTLGPLPFWYGEGPYETVVLRRVR
jgi:hypothetical protein